jgi:serine/threonine protein kinase/Flp pilus assembly protein TadD
MADASWSRIERLFDRARHLAPAERSAFLDAECAADAALRDRLNSLLAAHDHLDHASDIGSGSGFLEVLDPFRAATILEDLSPAPTVIGRYDVVRQLGRGGMGVVYLARDPALDRQVALKLLPVALGADARAARRFMEEARAASALDHPNIATVYEVGQAESARHYIAMAYYDGGTVRDRIARGPLPFTEAADLGVQIADGLAAAHAAAIVHRDIKPENLIVTSAGLLKILDFGVASAATAELTQTGGTAGTVAYMSPEQTRGGRIDGRADLWALGVVLYEMLTGVRPFAGDAQAAVIYGIRSDIPESIRALRPDIPPALADIVERCLEKDPADRFSSATAVAAALRRAVTSTGPSDGLPRRLTWPRARTAVVSAFALLAIGAGTHTGLRTLSIGPFATLSSRGLIADQDRIILADFTTTESDSRIGRVVTEALRIDLLQSPTLRLAEPHGVAAALRRMDRDPADGVSESAARELALRDGHKAVITGEIGALGGGYVLTARVIAAADGATLAAVRETARDSTDLIDAVDRLSKRVRERIGESLRTLRAAEPLPRVATASLPALRRYAEANHLAWAGGDNARIAALLEEAVALDSTFAAAHRSLATTYWNMRADRSRTVAATRAAYEMRGRLPEREGYLMEGAYYWHVLGDRRQARQSYNRVLALDPDDAAARNNLGLALLFDGEPVEAERVLRERLGHDAPTPIFLNLARALYFQDRTDAALAVLDSVAQNPAAAPAAEIMRARLLAGDGRWARAEAVSHDILQRFGNSPQVRTETLRGLWHLALVQGRLDEAERHFTELETSLERTGALDALARARIQRADARRSLLGDTAGALAALRTVLTDPAVDVLAVGATVAPRLAAALAAAGDTARAARLVDTWEALPLEARGDPDTFSPGLARARIDRLGGRPDLAAERLRVISSGTIQAIHYLPDLGRAYHLSRRPASAIAAFEHYLAFRHSRRLHRVPEYLGPVLIQLAGLYEVTGDDARALATHARLTDLWRGADPELQHHVDHARSRIAALSHPDGG